MEYLTNNKKDSMNDGVQIIYFEGGSKVTKNSFN